MPFEVNVKGMSEKELMGRFSFTLPPDLIEKVDEASGEVGMNRSQIVREALTHWLNHTITDQNLHGKGIAVIHFEYDHEDMRVVENIMKVQHGYERIITSTTHVHLSHSRCFELVICRGELCDIKEMAKQLRSIKGIMAFFVNFSKND